MQIIEGIVVSAFRAASFLCKRPSGNDLYKHLMDNLRAVEYALSDTPQETLWIASLYGVLLPDNAVIDESGIWIKKSVIGSRAELPSSFACRMQPFDAVEIQKRGDVQLATFLPYRLIDMQHVVDGRGEDFSLLSVKGFEEAQADLRKRREACVRTIALGLLLSDDSANSIWFRWGTSLNPAGLEGSTEMNPQSDASLYKSVSRLTENQIDSWKQWIGIISNVDYGSVELAMRKIVSASNDRINSEDILLDSVTAWENLVGGEGENTFKVTAALGLLLGNKDESPRMIQDRCKKIYITRSRLIHGSSQKIKMNRLYDDSEYALKYAKRALKKILCERRDLLRLKDSEARVRSLILGEIAEGNG